MGLNATIAYVKRNIYLHLYYLLKIALIVILTINAAEAKCIGRQDTDATRTNV